MADFPELFRWHLELLDRIRMRGPCSFEDLLGSARWPVRLRRWVLTRRLAQLENLDYVARTQNGRYLVTTLGQEV